MNFLASRNTKALMSNNGPRIQLHDSTEPSALQAHMSFRTHPESHLTRVRFASGNLKKKADAFVLMGHEQNFLAV